MRSRACSGSAERSVARKTKTGARVRSMSAEEKILGQRKESRGKWESEKPLDLR